MQRLVCLSNIPTPYRVHFFEELSKALKVRGVGFSVKFMAATEPGRHWSFDPGSWTFEHSFDWGVHPYVAERLFHFNPGTVKDLFLQPPTWLLVSGSWYLPTVLFSVFLAKLTRTRTFFWSESNLAYVEHRSRVVSTLRSWAMGAFDGYAVPGFWAREYVLHFVPAALQGAMINLPNVVDERRFREGVARLRMRRSELLTRWGVEEASRPILLTAARLEPIKGMKELVQSLVSSELEQVTLLIAGDGSEREALSSLVAAAGWEDRIRLLGFLQEPDILELLALADAFILPSLGDPYPLAVIEAGFAGLPLLLSDRVGCHPEALEPGQSGLLFDPLDSSSIQRCLRDFAALDPAVWSGMGSRSRELAEERFSTERVIPRFVDELLKV